MEETTLSRNEERGMAPKDATGPRTIGPEPREPAAPKRSAAPASVPAARRKVSYVRDLSRIKGLKEAERATLEQVAERYAFRVNDYYLKLIDFSDPLDPIRQLVIPRAEELADWGALDASNEAAVTVAKGVQHKYRDTVLLLVNEVCGAYCRYCFRKRLFMNDSEETSHDVRPGLRYIAAHPEVTNVLLTGGDPLVMGTRRLKEILLGIRQIPHVGIIRIGSKMPAFNPFRILDDPELLETIAACSTAEKRVYIMAHFDHPRELTSEAIAGLAALQRAGAVVVNQCPLIKGVNDDPGVLANLFRTLSFVGAPQYYLFQGRPTQGNQPYEIPIVEGIQIFEEAKRQVSGLAKRVRFAMSHETGKVEFVGLDDRHIYARYHRAKDPANEGRFMVFHRDDSAYWLDGLRPVEGMGSPPDLGRREQTQVA